MSDVTLTLSLMLAVDDAGEAAKWYESALGATELWSVGCVRGLAISGAPFFLHESTNEGFASPNVLGQTTVRIEVFADDPDRLIAHAVAAGAVGAPDGVQSHHAPWGVHRQGGFTDPFGHVWLVGDRSPLVSDPTAP